MVGQEEYFRNLQEYIANIELELKAPEAIYEERLAVCKDCDLLLEGMCRVCGCYVELRAAMKKNACPRHRWGSVVLENTPCLNSHRTALSSVNDATASPPSSALPMKIYSA
ncbi:MAG: hypothetical protein HFH80_13060, partial [Lachnospiraceae bacterium]|nr:hypothetical protein [Lachnospiraceae bacterium]